jgi:hypothetical protein
MARTALPAPVRSTARALLLVGVSLAVAACQAASPIPEVSPMTDPIVVTSPAFDEGGAIPARHTCDGADISPPLAWTGAPAQARAFALIVDDPDARGFVHWAVADLESAELAEDVDEGTQGRNAFGRIGYGGPCPPSGSHRYVFTVFALSEPLGLAPGFSAEELRSAMEDKVLASGSLTASYRRGG